MCLTPWNLENACVIYRGSTKITQTRRGILVNYLPRPVNTNRGHRWDAVDESGLRPVLIYKHSIVWKKTVLLLTPDDCGSCQHPSRSPNGFSASDIRHTVHPLTCNDLPFFHTASLASLWLWIAVLLEQSSVFRALFNAHHLFKGSISNHSHARG